jgi:hypothetical protein
MYIEHSPKPVTKLQRSGMNPYVSQRGGFHVCAKNHMPLLRSLALPGVGFYKHGAPNGAFWAAIITFRPQGRPV